MKRMHVNPLCAPLAAAAMLLSASNNSEATFITTSWTNTFNASSGSQNSSTSWNYWYDMWQQGYGSNYGWGPISLDLTMNCTNNPGPTSQVEAAIWLPVPPSTLTVMAAKTSLFSQIRSRPRCGLITFT